MIAGQIPFEEITAAMGLKQPLAGLIATALIIAVALFYISRFTLGDFLGWGSYYVIGLIPAQVMAGVLWGGKMNFMPGLSQPFRGLASLAVVLVIGGFLSWLCWSTIGGGISPPVPNVVYYIIVAVATTFFWCIVWGGWPFTKLISNSFLAGLATLLWCYLLNYIVYRVFYNFAFLKGAPVYVEGLDPGGMFNGMYGQVLEVTALAIMFVILHFDLWPFTNSPSIMQQPTLGLVWTLTCFVIGGALMYLGVGVLGMDAMKFLVSVPIPFIFGTIVLLNMLEGSLFATMQQPVKGIVSAASAAVLGTGLAQFFLAVAPSVSGQAVNPGPPTYDQEIWLASALLAVTFPFLVAFAVYLEFWPVKKTS
jgi:hypothetical protein